MPAVAGTACCPEAPPSEPRRGLVGQRACSVTAASLGCARSASSAACAPPAAATAERASAAAAASAPAPARSAAAASRYRPAARASASSARSRSAASTACRGRGASRRARAKARWWLRDAKALRCRQPAPANRPCPAALQTTLSPPEAAASREPPRPPARCAARAAPWRWRCPRRPRCRRVPAQQLPAAVAERPAGGLRAAAGRVPGGRWHRRRRRRGAFTEPACPSVRPGRPRADQATTTWRTDPKSRDGD